MSQTEIYTSFDFDEKSYVNKHKEDGVNVVVTNKSIFLEPAVPCKHFESISVEEGIEITSL